ncbi:hypothetical protein ACFPA8_12380 [Streptomyces ovatisporus]|uniref:Uncharacterized protein n=1 Tax=Streptomyces ovatisporus TaxID=1128682 RepID=A0ABV9A4U7_9ACTN
MGQHVTGLRRFAFPSAEGRTVYVQEGGILTAVADAVEAETVNDAKAVLELARNAMGPDGGDDQVLRFVCARLAEVLDGVIRVCDARGERLPQSEE